MTPTLEEVAADAFAYVEGPSTEFDRQPDLVLRNLPHPMSMYGMALRPRLHDVEAGLERARSWFSNRGRDSYTWMVADDARPTDLVERLLAAGALPDADDPVYEGMVLTRGPERVGGVEVRKVASFEEQAAATEISWRSFGFADEVKAELRAGLRERYEVFSAFDGIDSFVALVEGQVVGSASAAYLPCGIYLLGGNVAEEARGRGVYRALVRARWDEAVARGTPALVVQAGKMSKSILERVGFTARCTVRAFVDSATPQSRRAG